jgi:hypothetical protein
VRNSTGATEGRLSPATKPHAAGSPISIDGGLDGEHERGRALRLVDARAVVAEVRKKPFRIVDRLVADIAVVQASPRPTALAGYLPAEKTLTDLPGAHDGHGGEEAEVCNNGGLQSPGIFSTGGRICQRYIRR